MADRLLSELPESTALAATDLAYVQGGSTGRRITAENFGNTLPYVPQGTAVITRTIREKLRDGTATIFDFIPTAQHAAIRDGTTTFDASTEIQSAIDETNLAAQDADTSLAVAVKFPGSGLVKANVTLKTGVILRGDGGVYDRPTFRLDSFNTNAIVVDTPVTAISRCGVGGLKVTGNFAVGNTGIRFRDVLRGIVHNCFFDGFDNQAVLCNDAQASHFVNLFAQNCLLDRTQAAKVGVIQMDSASSDNFILGSEFTASLTGTGNQSDANLFLCAGMIDGAQHFISDSIFEISDIGLHLAAGASGNSRMSNVRCDLNQAHGFEVLTNGQFSNCTALNNSQHADNTYDGFHHTLGQALYSNCLAWVTATNKHQYGFNDQQNSDSVRNRYSNCRSLGHGTAPFFTQNFAGANVDFAPGAHVSFPDLDTTPDVGGGRNFRANNTGATSITAFDNSISGQEITILFTNSNTTIVDAAGIQLAGGVNFVGSANDLLTLVRLNSVWYEKSRSVN